MASSDPPERPSPERLSPVPGSSPALAVALGALALLIVVLSVAYHRHFSSEVRSVVEERLEAVAELKVQQVVLWRTERSSDAAVFHGNRHFADLVDRAYGSPGEREALREWLEQVREAYGYDRIAWIDTTGAERIAVSAGEDAGASHPPSDALRVMRTGEVEFADFHRDTPDGLFHLTILVPVLGGRESSPLGVLAIRVDPRAQLYPMLRRWPMPRRTAEAVLVRREDDDAVVLNPLESRPEDTPGLRLPLSKERVTTVLAARGVEGAVDGIDPDGERVVAVIRAVPDSPWSLVARIDSDEAFAPLRSRLWWTVGLVAGLLLGLGGLAGFL
ncbi:MAG: cache domain-containing protein, partial [Gemmatimonadota bacterium]|nr:cache domain-containing protein [Gemmatimonadota bacterium]